ncbi:hypothetical protein [Flagellimonas flava]|uniref:hypothetical protein n=1 Tax=Flagellimonas flava TaxID=570519 RepID=UPI003D649678
MVLDEDKILELIETPSNGQIAEWKDQHNTLDIYLNGGDVAPLLEKVKNFENDEQKKLRQKIARSTKDLLSYLLNPVQKVFSANGFNEEIELGTEAAEKKFFEHLEELPEGMSMRDWMKTYWLEAYISDPNGVLLVESEPENNSADKIKSYPTYKSINTVHDYLLKWNDFEYIIFLHKKVRIDEEEVQIYRVYDEEKDALYYVKDKRLKKYGDEGTETEVGESHIFIHKKGYVPAVLASDIVNKNGGKKPLIEKIDEILKEYLRDSSVHSIYKFLHGFPIFWRYAMKCTTCSGEGKINNPRYDSGQPISADNEPKIQCPTCEGKRLKVTRDVSDGVTLPIPTSSEDPKLAPDLAGFVAPDLETWKMQVEEMHEMKKDMFFSLWGTSIVEDQGREKTATEAYLNIQPITDKLNQISKTAENKENKLVKFMGEAMFPESFKESKIKYGKRFLIETPDVLWEKYITAKEKNAPVSTLDYLYEQFLMAEYHNDLTMMERKVKEFNLEPFVHYSVSDLKGVATQEQMQGKILFSQWSSDADFDNELEQLKKDFEEFVNNNKQENEVSTKGDQNAGGGEGQE